jgi:hypothetical protein
MAHGTTGTRDLGLPSYAARFVAAGLAVLAFTSVTLKLFARAVRDSAGARFGRPAVMMPMLGRPGEVAVFTGEKDYADDDTSASMRLTEQAAEDAPQAHLRRYSGSHFSAYSGEVFERMVSDEVGFLTEHLRPRSTAES